MIAALKPYPAYKDSGVEWLEEVPEHWEVSTLRRKLRTPDGIKVGPFGSQLKLEQMSPSGYKVYGQANVIARDFARGTKFVNQEKFDELSACEVLPGDLLVTMMGTSGRCTHVPEDAAMGIMDSHLLRLRTDTSINVRFASWIIDESPYVKEQITVAGKGSIMHGLNSGMVKALVLALPPLPEQTAIARYLDYTDRRIQRYISAKQKLITLLEEQRQAIIHQAVTGQIDVRTGQPYPAYQDSGVEWLGEVPERWEVRKLRRCVTVSGGMTPSMEVRRFWGGLIPWVTPKDMKRAVISDSSLRVTDSALQETQLRLVEPPAVLIVVRGMILARRVPIASTTAPVTINQDMKALRTVKGTKAAFLARLLDSAQEAFMPLIDEAGHGTRRLPMERWRELVIAIPPEAEQAAIVEHLDNRTAAVDTAISHTQHQIDLLSEYRTRLISDVVTGKLDVREAAAKLPEVDPLETEADSEEPLGTDVESNLDELGTKVKEVAT